MDKKRFAVSKGPVNQRTAPSALRAPRKPALSANLKGRVNQMSTRRQLGAPLQTAANATSPGGPSHRRSYFLPAACGVAALASWLLVPGLAGIAAAAFLTCLAGFAMYRSGRAPVMSAAGASLGAVTLDLESEALRILDAIMESAVLDAPAEVLTAVRAAKSELSLLLQSLQGSRGSGNWGAEDSAYVQQCVLRYLPDSLQGYLHIAPERRGVPVGETGSTAHALLIEQLALIQSALQIRHAKLREDAGERLLSQHRFLHAKERQPH